MKNQILNEFPFLTKIEIGGGSRSPDLFPLLADHNLTNEAKKMLGGYFYGDEWFDTFALEEPREVALHTATVEQITGRDRTTLDQLEAVLFSKGYEFCPAEIGPRLRAWCTANPDKISLEEFLRVAMSPIRDKIFTMRNEADGPWLCATSPVGFTAKDVLVFSARQS